MTNLIESYKIFLKQGEISYFLNSCFDYDFNNYKSDIEKLFELHQKNNAEFQTFHMNSNGSSGASIGYLFGSRNEKLISIVEDSMRACPDRLMRINSSYPFYDTTRFKKITLEENREILKIDWTSKKSEDFFIKNTNFGMTIETQPHICRMILSHPKVLDHIKNQQIQIFSTCDDLSVHRSKIQVKDRVIDWKTGVNFFECEYKSKHFLPIWFEKNGLSFNLLNLTKIGHEISDLFEPIDFYRCQCGRVATGSEFVSHFAQKPNHVSGARLDSSTINSFCFFIPDDVFHLQLIEFEGKINVLIDSLHKMNNNDLKNFLDFVESFFGKKSILHENKVFKVGNYKMPFLWKTNSFNLIDSSFCII